MEGTAEPEISSKSFVQGTSRYLTLRGRLSRSLNQPRTGTGCTRAQCHPWGRSPPTPRSRSVSWAQACTHLQVKPSPACVP